MQSQKSALSTSKIVAQPSTTEPIDYEWIDGVETLEEYTYGGFHPVLIGDILHERYRVVDKLGYGGYSTTWLAHDHRRQGYVAVKVGIAESESDQRPTEHSFLAKSDARILSQLSHGAIPKVLDQFLTVGPNGTHPCYAMALAQGSLHDALSKPMFPVETTRVLAAKLVQAVSYLHSRGFVHGDLHIRNMLVKSSGIHELSIPQFREKFQGPRKVPIRRLDGQPLTPNVPPYAVLPVHLSKPARQFSVDDAGRFLLADFGESFSPAIEKRLGRDSCTPLPGRAPETFFEPDEPLSFPSDVWTMGTAIWEILSMKFPFSQHVPADELIAEHIDVLGYDGFPAKWRESWERQDSEEGDFFRRPTRHPNDHWPPLESAWEEFNQKYRRKREVTGVFGEEESRAILDLMRGMFRFRPEKRLTADEVLKSEWMVKWALPELEKAGA